MSEHDIEPVEIPKRLLADLGEADEGTRLYRRYGSDDEFEDWYGAVWGASGSDGDVSPGGVAMYVRVSRAAVYKRINEGRLTAFCFHTAKERRKKGRVVLEYDDRPSYICIPVAECKSWARLVEKRPSRS